MNQKPLVIVFAGHPGSGKTPVAYYLSQNLGLPVFNTDAIRTEVHEDNGEVELNIELFEARRTERFNKLLEKKKSFIYDGSVDRRWDELRGRLDREGFRYFIISFNLSPEFLRHIWRAKGSSASPMQLEKYRQDQINFLEKYGSEVGLTITDANFAERLRLSLAAVSPLI